MPFYVQGLLMCKPLWSPYAGICISVDFVMLSFRQNLSL